MNPIKTFLCIVSALALLGLTSFLFPKEGIDIAFTTLRFPSLSEMFPLQEESREGEVLETPEEAVRRMLEETRAREFSAYADSLAYYENFFREGASRFELPDDDPAWFDRFFADLEYASLGDSLVRIIHYGDSQLEEDRITSTIREDLQTLFGGAGPGMIPAVATIPAMTYSHSAVGDLERKVVFGDSTTIASHNRYGPLGQVGELNGAATISFRKRENKKEDFPHIEGFREVRLLVGRESPKFSASLSYEAKIMPEEGEKPVRKKFNAEAPIIEKKNRLTIYRWPLEHPSMGATLRVRGRAEIYGISADGEFGVAVDNVAMRGSSGTVFHKMDKELLKSSYEALSVKLLILEYGGNLVPGMNPSREEWSRKIVTRQIHLLQEIYPDADIVFIGPADMCKQIDGKWRSYPGLQMTIDLLKSIAKENGLAYWDMHRVMGGSLSMISWVKQNPPLGSADYVHFTRAGASHMGNLFSSSLRMYYDYYKFRNAHGLDAKKLSEIKNFSDSLETTRERDSLLSDSSKENNWKGDSSIGIKSSERTEDVSKNEVRVP